jgi:hypothetical protein
MGIKDRSAKRRTRIVAHRAASFKEAEEWDLDFWQNQSPEQRLSALVAIRRDAEKVVKGRLSNTKATRKGQ